MNVEIHCLYKRIGELCIFRRRPPVASPLTRWFVGHEDARVIENYSRYSVACRYARSLRRKPQN